MHGIGIRLSVHGSWFTSRGFTGCREAGLFVVIEVWIVRHCGIPGGSRTE